MSLVSISHPLASPKEQLRVLHELKGPKFPVGLTATTIDVLQVNVGKLCNQTCRHCHVDAGPDRREVMTRETAEFCIAALAEAPGAKLDITGGAPELNANFRWMVEQARGMNRHVMDRCNLSILLLPSQKDLAEFLAHHQVEIVASLPYFLAEQTDAQRGAGVFDKSIEAIRTLNRLGYGREDSGLVLNLVYNPVGAYLPPSQMAMQADFKRQLSRRYGVTFNSLYTITNMPISRFLQFLIDSGNLERYMTKLAQAYNPVAADAVMCRTMVSVGWNGTLYDCDFNQMLDLPIENAPHIRDFGKLMLEGRRIITDQHCFGCTAGSGSSCSGAVA